MDDCVRLLLVLFPGQGYVNTSLQFASRLVKMGVNVTFVTAFSALNCVTKSVADTPPGLTFSGISDGYDDGNGHLWSNHNDADRYMKELKIRGVGGHSRTPQISGRKRPAFRSCGIHHNYGLRRPSCSCPSGAFNSPLASASDHLGYLLLYYFNGYGESIGKNVNDPSWSVELPALLMLTRGDLPSFLLASSTSNFALPLINAHFDVLDTETNPKVLINSFDALESGALRAIERLNFIAVGPLIPSAFLDGEDPSTDTSSGGDLFQHSKDYVVWLNSKPSESVIYVAFGSYASITRQQMEEIERGLLECGRPFLWVVSATEDGKLSCKEKLNQRGMVVSWCSQVEVLSHLSVGCFMTHCGWNSSFESLISGVPLVAFPQWADQATNGKLIEDVWKTGKRVKTNGDGIVESGEIKECTELVMRLKSAQNW